MMLRVAMGLCLVALPALTAAPLPKEVKRGVPLEGTWEVLEDCRKVYVIFEQAKA